MDDTVLNKSELVVDALQYAHDHNLDVSNKEDVQKILDALDLDHSENIDEFFELLQDSETFLNITVRGLESKKSKIIN